MIYLHGSQIYKYSSDIAFWSMISAPAYFPLQMPDVKRYCRSYHICQDHHHVQLKVAAPKNETHYLIFDTWS